MKEQEEYFLLNNFWNIFTITINEVECIELRIENDSFSIN